MTNKNNKLHKNRLSPLRTKRRFLLLGGVFLAVILIASISLSLATTPAQTPTQTIHTARPNTQFQLNVAYAYAGEGPANDSYVADNSLLMSPKTLHPTAVQFNVTRLPSIQIEACDAAIEFYSVRIMTNTGVVEKNCYFIGTNYKPSFSDAQLTTLFDHVYDVISPRNLTTPIRGNFEFNMSDNESILSVTVGSSGDYTTARSTSGLWTKGQPNIVSVTVQRIGYLTISNDSVSVYRDSPDRNTTATAQLSSYGNGFLHNNIVPANKLANADLFHPEP
jgi:hypothetical protein